MPYHIVCLAGKKIQVEDNGLWCFFFKFSESQIHFYCFSPTTVTCICTSEESLQYITSKVGNFIKNENTAIPKNKSSPLLLFSLL